MQVTPAGADHCSNRQLVQHLPLDQWAAAGPAAASGSVTALPWGPVLRMNRGRRCARARTSAIGIDVLQGAGRCVPRPSGRCGACRAARVGVWRAVGRGPVRVGRIGARSGSGTGGTGPGGARRTAPVIEAPGTDGRYGSARVPAGRYRLSGPHGASPSRGRAPSVLLGCARPLRDTGPGLPVTGSGTSRCTAVTGSRAVTPRLSVAEELLPTVTMTMRRCRYPCCPVAAAGITSGVATVRRAVDRVGLGPCNGSNMPLLSCVNVKR
jgi:hypothetical protein